MKKLFVITFATIISMLLAGKIFDSCYKKYWWPFFEKLDVVLKDSKYYDGIYLGDSRVHFGINPYYIDSITLLKTYNAGIGAATINEIKFLATSYMENHTAPRFAVISIGYGSIMKSIIPFANPCYYFFYTNHFSVDSILQKSNYHTTLFKILPVLKYTAFDDFNKISIAENIKGNTIVKNGGVVYNGFINNTTNSFNIGEVEKSQQITDKAYFPGIKILEETISALKEKKVIVILVYPPATHLEEKPKSTLEIKIDTAISSLAQKYDTHLIHYDYDSSFTNNLFSDGWHLNIKGTILYSNKIGVDVKSILQNALTTKE